MRRFAPPIVGTTTRPSRIVSGQPWRGSNSSSLRASISLVPKLKEIFPWV